MNWLREWFYFPESGDLLIEGSYNPWLLLLSILVAIYSSFIGFQLSSQARKVSKTSFRHHIILLTGSIALGSGVWSMHFVGMLAFKMQGPVSYDPAITILSMLPSIVASWVALLLIVQDNVKNSHLLLGGILVGIGIGTMHYIGMAAMQMEVLLRYDPLIFGLSILVAVLLAFLSLWIRFGLEKSGKLHFGELHTNIISGCVMGVAISGMHYTGMEAARFIALPGMNLIGLEQVGDNNIPWLLALGVTLTTLAVTTLVFTINLIYRYRDVYREARSNEMRLQATMETTIDAIVIHDRTGLVLSVNNAIETILGWSPAELEGQNIKTFIPESLHEEFDRSIEQYLETGKSEYIGVARDLEALHKDDHLVQIRLAVGHVELPEENLFVAFMSDITPRIALENELRQAKVKAEQAAKARATFLANMSHEIRTPMNSIIGFSEVLSETELSPDQRKYMDNIAFSARSLLHLIDEVLDFSKLDQNKIQIDKQNFSLVEEIDMVISTLWVQASKKDLELEAHVSPDLEKNYYGAPDRIRQVLTNLISNGIKFTDEGKVTLEVVPEDDGQIRFSVTDTGIGIPPDRLDEIFKAFTQVENSRSRRFGGTGLGTTISKQLVELMGGTINVTSELNEGSCFTFKLPLESPVVEETAVTQDQIQLPPLNILVAEDIRLNLDLVVLLLERAGHTVSAVGDGEQVLEYLAQNNPDLLLMDVQMPVMDGLTAARRIRKMEADSGETPLPIIALTASVSAEDKQAAFDAGMDGFISKPIDKHLLDLEIASVMQLDVDQTGKDEPQPQQ